MRENDYLDPGVEGRIILKINLQEVGFGDMEGIELAQDRHRWRELSNALMNLGVAQNEGKFLG